MNINFCDIQIFVQKESNSIRIDMEITLILYSACDRWSMEQPTDFIIGGLQTKPRDFPWMVPYLAS